MIFKPKQSPEPTMLDVAISNIFSRMEETEPTTKEYAALVDELSKLLKLKENELPKRIDPNIALQVAGSLAGVLLILNYERVNVITTKAAAFVMKAK